MLQTLSHYSLHFVAIGAIAYWYDKENWKRNWLILLSTMLVDLDHLFANPMFHPGRCSIGFHILHSEYVVPFYFLGAVVIKRSLLKLILIGLTFHMFTDFSDCIWMYSECAECNLAEIFSGF